MADKLTLFSPKTALYDAILLCFILLCLLLALIFSFAFVLVLLKPVASNEAEQSAANSKEGKRRKALKMPCSLSRIPVIVLCSVLLAHILSYPLLLLIDVTNKNVSAALVDILLVFYTAESFIQGLVIFLLFPALIVIGCCYDPLRKGGRPLPRGSATGASTPGKVVARSDSRMGPIMFCLRQCCTILYWTICLNVVLVVVFGAAYPFLGYIDKNIPLLTMPAPDTTTTVWTNVTLTNSTLLSNNTKLISTTVTTPADEYRIVFPIFYQAIILIPSYLILIPTLALGLSGVPLSFLGSCLNRPTRLRLADYQRLREYTKTRAEQLMLKGADMEDRQQEGTLASYSLEYLRFKREVQNLKEEWSLTHFRFAQGGISIWRSIMLVLGMVLTTPLTLVWLLHIVLYMCIMPTEHRFFGFLDDLSKYADKLTAIAPNTPEVPLVGAAIMIVLVCYLMWCIVCGFFRAIRTIPFVYMKEPQLRHSSAFEVLAAVMVLYVCHPALKQLCYYAFVEYFKGSAIDTYFESIEKLKGFGIIYPYWIYLLVLGVLVGVICNLVGTFCLRTSTKQEKTKAFLNAAMSPAS